MAVCGRCWILITTKHGNEIVVEKRENGQLQLSRPVANATVVRSVDFREQNTTVLGITTALQQICRRVNLALAFDELCQIRASRGSNLLELKAAPAPRDALDRHPELNIGMLVYCHLLVRGEVKVTEAMVVKVETWNVVIACPAACALTKSGDWAIDAKLGAWQTFACACVKPCMSVPVVFYSVDANAVGTNARPDAISFKTSSGQHAVISKESLLEMFHGEAQSDSLRMQVAVSRSSTSIVPYQELRIGKVHSLFFCNSVLIIPDLLTREECHELIDSADRRAMGGRRSPLQDGVQKGLARLPICELDLGAQMLSTSIISERMLAFLEQHLPQVAEQLFGRNLELKKMRCSFALGEPAVNRYMEGGAFHPHTDKQSVTINVLLSDLGAFSGGGTMFWPQDAAASNEAGDAVLVQPPQGTAVIFNGTVTHAGRAVMSGIRHLYVGSFTLWSNDE